MRAIATILLALLPLAGGAIVEAGIPLRARAVLIGVTRYENRDWNTIKFPAADASAVGGALVDRDLGGWREEDIRVLVDEAATHGAVEDEIMSTLLGALPGDLIIVYYSGHGFRNGNRTFLAMHDSTPDRPSETALDLADLSNWLTNYGVGASKVVVLDACHSGGVFDGLSGILGDLAPGVLILTSSGSGEVSTELADRGHGNFTYHLLESMSHAGGHGPYVTLGQAWSYITERIQHQTPQQGGSMGMDVPLVQRPGTLMVNIQPWARVRKIRRVDDGRDFAGLGFASPCVIPLPAGRYEVLVDHPNFAGLTIPIEVSAGAQTVLAKKFRDFRPDEASDCLLYEELR